MTMTSMEIDSTILKNNLAKDFPTAKTEEIHDGETSEVAFSITGQ